MKEKSYIVKDKVSGTVVYCATISLARKVEAHISQYNKTKTKNERYK